MSNAAQSGDSQELQALFDSISQSNAAPETAPVSKMTVQGDSEELQHLFDAVAQAAHHLEETPEEPAKQPAPPPALSKPVNPSGDNEELQNLFDSIAASAASAEDTSESEPVLAADSPLEKPQEKKVVIAGAEIDESTAETMFAHIGSLTRKLHDTLRELGYDKSIERVVSEIPNARDRLSYIAAMTEQSAMKTLNAIETAQPHQDKMEETSSLLADRWDKLFSRELSLEEFKHLAQETHAYLRSVPNHTQTTSKQLMEIMMAQDFQDLTGQVIKKVVDTAQDMERQLLDFLLEFNPAAKTTLIEHHEPDNLMNGPVISAEGRTDVVTSQQQVDDLLESLGF